MAKHSRPGSPKFVLPISDEMELFMRFQGPMFYRIWSDRFKKGLSKASLEVFMVKFRQWREYTLAKLAEKPSPEVSESTSTIDSKINETA